MAITTRFTEMFGCRYPIQQAGMGGYASPSLALAVVAGGGFGMLSGVAGAAALKEQLAAVPSGAPVGVNFLAPFLDRDAVELAAERSALVEFFWGEPDEGLVGAVHAAGSRVGWQVGSLDEARRARDVGCDVIVAQGIEAGGHVRGTVGLIALLSEVRQELDTPLIAAGGIGTGRSMAAAIVAGADAVRVGTRFVAATESIAHPLYVEALVRASAEDTVLTTAFGEGWPDAPHRVLASCVEAGRARGSAQVWDPGWPMEDDDGDVLSRALYAGQSVGAIHERQPVATIIDELVVEAERLLARSR
jgi:NAD(P)H-dependent flavin oxidoreductase YrpB (nitropropane dioxygenase family)